MFAGCLCYTVAFPQLGCICCCCTVLPMLCGLLLLCSITSVGLCCHCRVALPLLKLAICRRHCHCRAALPLLKLAICRRHCHCHAVCRFHAVAAVMPFGRCGSALPLLCCLASVNVCFSPHGLLIHCLTRGAGRATSWATYLPAIGVLDVCVCVCIYLCAWVYGCLYSSATALPVVIGFTSLATYQPASYMYCWYFTADAAPLSGQDAICSALRAVYLSLCNVLCLSLHQG